MRGPNQLAAVGVVAPKLNAQGSRHGAFGLARIGALVLVSVATPCLPRGQWVGMFVDIRDCDDGSRGQARRQVVGYVVQSSGSLAEVEVTLVGVSDQDRK